MKRPLGLVLYLLGVVLAGSVARADGTPPVTVGVTEKEPGRFLVRWRVPKQLPPQAIPTPVLPATCTPTGERTLDERSGAWFLQQTYRCPDGLAGELVGIDYPFLNVTVSTLLRVELLSGERYAHVLAPGESSWRVPASSTGRAPPLLRDARDAVLAGALHFARNPVHLFFLVSLLLLGTLGTALRLATVFTACQLGALALNAISGLTLGPAYAEIGLAVATALLAREALRADADNRQLVALASAAGLVHGLGIANTDLLRGTLVVLGLDAALVLGIVAAALVVRALPRRSSWARVPRVAAYLVAGGALALALSSPVPASAAAEAATPIALQLPGLSVGTAASASASRRLAARMPEAALQSFVSIEAFEVRHEVLVRLRDVADRLDLDPSDVLEVREQEEVRERVRELVTLRTGVTLDGGAAEPARWRVDFLTLDAQGALPRPSPVAEPVETAWIGVTAVYPTEATPAEVALSWGEFDVAAGVPATVTDPESSRSVELTPELAVLGWKNELAEDPAPVVRATAVEPATLWVPFGSLAALGVCVLCLVTAARGRRRWLSLALARTALVGAVVLAPLGRAAWALELPARVIPDPPRARRILAGVLPNLYRAFEFPTESTVYDRLALTVTGETLHDVYLEHRQSVEAQERGGAKSRVEAVEVVDVGPVEPHAGGGFVVDATWTVSGTVTHFGHRHFRQNGYDARVVVVPVDGSWKIQTIDVLEEERLR